MEKGGRSLVSSSCPIEARIMETVRNLFSSKAITIITAQIKQICNHVDLTTYADIFQFLLCTLLPQFQIKYFLNTVYWFLHFFFSLSE